MAVVLGPGCWRKDGLWERGVEFGSMLCKSVSKRGKDCGKVAYLPDADEIKSGWHRVFIGRGSTIAFREASTKKVIVP